MSKSPITVQQWVDTLPPQRCPTPAYTPKTRKFLSRDLSFQSDDGSSHCSSVESVLELRKPDPEAVLLGLGFGPPKSSNAVSRIPQRFLQPSKLLTQIDINKFIEQQRGDLSYAEKHFSAPTSPAHQRPKSY